MTDQLSQPDSHAAWRYTLAFILEGRWKQLPDHLDATTPDHIAHAVCFGLDYSPHEVKRGRGYLSPADARWILTATGAFEPCDRRAVLRTFFPPSPCRQENRKVRWPVNSGFGIEAADKAWSRVFGIEAGWLAYDRAGLLEWTELGRNRYAAGERPTFTETSGQEAFAF